MQIDFSTAFDRVNHQGIDHNHGFGGPVFSIFDTVFIKSITTHYSG